MSTSEEKVYTKEELDKKLTEKERIFCHEYIIDWNGARSARKAGYSEDTAKEIASQNLTKLHIKQYIDFIKDDIEKEAGITKLRQLNELAKIAYSSIAHLHDTWIDLKDFEELTNQQKEAIESIDTRTEKRKTPDGENIEVKQQKIKLYSKTAALEQINKMLGYNAPEEKKIDLEGSGVQIYLPDNGRD